ncbi:SCO family protein [Ramlibacter alkalitolerans]|uniref:SCO family protein n=1 Tax=Ramlibacter alkalitolerans TaxID=2039631 RepID=UPI001F485893|nr:SCO family protein [Ramlibacter alkalitolerans]
MITIRTLLQLAFASVAVALAGIALPACAGDEHQHHHHHQHEAGATPGYARQVAQYRLPAITLVRADGSSAAFPQEIDDGRPVLLNFIYTSCTAICPILSQSFAEFQHRLGGAREQVRMVSVSIDPEEDTPRRLTEYAKRFDAGRQWGFYTGSLAASVTLQKAFQSYFGDKMHHRPVTFLRAAPGQPWVRLDGFTSPDELLAEYRRLVHAH